jgi:hypothetical protein
MYLNIPEMDAIFRNLVFFLLEQDIKKVKAQELNFAEISPQ